MSTAFKNLSYVDLTKVPSAEQMVIGIVVSDWNDKITYRLLDGAVATLLAMGCIEENIIVRHVPGAFELPLGAQFFAQNTAVDGVIVLGCVIRGGTPHFDYVCSGATQGVVNVQLAWNVPIAFGLLTVDDEQQAIDRAGGKHGNKGDEAAATVVAMVALQEEMTPSDEEEELDQKEFLDLMQSVTDSHLS